MPRKQMCCVGNCQNLRQDALLFKIPMFGKRLDMWLKRLNRVCDTDNLTPGVSVVCRKHFETRFISPASRLINNAYPSLFTEDEISSGIPSLENAEVINIEDDHSYARKRHHEHNYNKDDPLTKRSKPETCEGVNVLKELNTTEIITAAQEISLPGCSKIENVPQTVLSTINIPGSVKTCTKIRQRLINKKSQLPKYCKRIYYEYKKAKRQLSFKKRAQNALRFCTETAFEKLAGNMNPYARKFLKMQISMCTTKKNARRFTTEEKIIALSIMKQSPKCYRFLQKIFILPSRSTLNAMISKIIIEPGINPQVFNLLKKEVESWDSKKKLCSIIFDEISLETALTYEKHKDAITGFVELQEKKSEIADHALVFMLRGAVYRWQQPITFYFCQGAASAIHIKNILKELVQAVVNLNLKPITLICDQGSAFQSAVNSMKEETRREQLLQNQHPDGTLKVSGVNLNIIYDPSHLIKGLRNNFLTKNIMMDGKISKWQDILDVYETDCQHTESRFLHKLNDQCVIPEKIKKMKVRNCVRVLSRTMSSALMYTSNFATYVDGRPVSTTLKNTAVTVAFFDKLFDSVNGATTSSLMSKGKELRKAVTEITVHHEFWPEAIKTLENLKFIDNKGIERSVPSIKNFIITLKSFMNLWQFFRENNIKIMRPRYFNSDPIENFFGQVRAYNYRNNDPDCHNFSCTFKSLLITRLVKFHSDSFNCEDDLADQAVNLKKLFEKKIDEPSQPTLNKNHVDNVLEQARRERMNTHSRAYTAGWVVGKILSNTACRECQNSLTSDVSLGIHDWISQREYNIAQKKRLKYPSEGAVRCFSTVITETNEYLEKNAHQYNLASNIKAYIKSKYSFDFINNCTHHKEHVLDYFINVTVRFTIMNWCNTINKILKGIDVIRLSKRPSESIPLMQTKALEKYKKKLKNKLLNK